MSLSLAIEEFSEKISLLFKGCVLTFLLGLSVDVYAVGNIILLQKGHT